MCPKRRRPPGVAIRGGRGVPRNRRENVRNLAGTGSSHSTAVDLGAINAAALACLPALVERWLHDGRADNQVSQAARLRGRTRPGAAGALARMLRVSS